MNNKRIKRLFFITGCPAFAGFVFMYLYPFIRTVWYSLINNTFQKRFAGFKNYADVLANPYFRRAAYNTAVFSVTGVTFIIVLSLLLAFGVYRLSEKYTFIKNFFLVPLLLPTAAIIFVWQSVFLSDGYYFFAKEAAFTDFWTMLPVYLIYIWKNTGLNLIILSAALASIPGEVIEAASLDGAAGFKLHRYVTLPLVSPLLLFVFVLSLVNSLRTFRESFLFFRTNYPPDPAYTIQFYINNHFLKLNYPTLTAASVMFTVSLVLLLSLVYRWENKLNEKTY
ncbi:MAG: sugar ABC transporter permease [Defluviitaleaceae bacterium]|nr:sugar ABC transporter permease [Defluviitaleaceae bacterium]